LRICDGKLQMLDSNKKWSFIDLSSSYLVNEIASGRFKLMDKHEEDPVITDFTGCSSLDAGYRYRIIATEDSFRFLYTTVDDKVWHNCDYSQSFVSFYRHVMKDKK